MQIHTVPSVLRCVRTSYEYSTTWTIGETYQTVFGGEESIMFMHGPRDETEE
jgi:hypothetical protein